MKRPLLSAILGGLAVALTVSVVIALASRPPDHDSFVRSTDASSNFDDQGLSVSASSTSCAPTDTTYLQWNLSDVTAGATLASVQLAVTAKFAVNTSFAVLALHQTEDDWTEGTLTANNAPAVGALIETQTAPSAAGQTVTFNSADLATYINDQLAGDDVASFVLQFESGCVAGVTFVLLEDSSSGTDGPALELQTCILGDVNCDCTVDDGDLSDVANLWRSGAEDLTYDSDRDVNKDGNINILDLMVVTTQLGSGC